MNSCVENIPHFIEQWGNQLQPHPDYTNYFESPVIGNTTFYSFFMMKNISLLLSPLLFLDMLLQHIWVNYRSFHPQLQDYQALIEKVKLTPRVWSSTVKFIDFLQYLTWLLGLSINLISFKKTKNRHNDTFQCAHTKNCFLPYYKFQNPYIRFCQNKEHVQINILEFKSTYYTLSSASCTPVLINQLSNFNFCYQSEPVTLHDINAILKHQPVEKPFAVALYSTTCYVKSYHSKIIRKNIIGYLKNESENILHLFLTPHLHAPTFDVFVLEFSSNNIIFNQKNVFYNRHITEGQYNYKNNSGPNKELLPQDYCICEHPDTERYHAPNTQSFSPLGKY